MHTAPGPRPKRPAQQRCPIKRPAQTAPVSNNQNTQTKIKMMTIFHTNSIFPALSALPMAGKAIATPASRRRRPTLSRRELRRLIAEMVD